MNTNAFLFAAMFAASIQAADVKLSWNPNDPREQVTGYNIYQQSGTNWIRVASTPTNEVVLSGLTNGAYTWYATATNIWGESGPSGPASTPSISKPPGNISLKITMTVATP